MKFENTEVFNFEGALRGMRNPKNSWNKSDSFYTPEGIYVIGDNDMKLAKKLIKAGNEHRKFLRQIFVSVDITAPLYFLKEFDTYKVATTANSCSTMHKIHSEPITLESFETGDYDMKYSKNFVEQYLIPYLEGLRLKYIETNDRGYWKELIRWLPEGWLQKRTWTADYETIRSMYHQRKYHPLHTEWVDGFCGWVETKLPYSTELIIE